MRAPACAIAAFQMRKPVAAAAQITPHDVEAEEGESLVVIDAGDGRGRRAIELADQKALRVDGGEAGGVGEARIPAFRRRPVGGDGDLVRPHRPNAQAACVRHFGLPTFMPAGLCPSTRAPISSRIAGSSIVAGMVQVSPSAIFFMVPRRILPERVFGRRAHRDRELERRDRADLLAHQRDDLLLDLRRRRG